MALLALAGGVACGSSPPPSEFPDAEALLSRMRETYACSRGISGEAKIDYFEAGTRVRADSLYVAALPSQVRFDVFSPFGLMLSTMTSDGEAFELYDLRQKVFLRGPASACNLERFSGVNVPPSVLVQLLRGEAPVLVHEPTDAAVAWERGLFGGGRYRVDIAGRHQATECIRVVPAPEDWALPWQRQRLWVTSVEVRQADYLLYRATLDDHAVAATSGPMKDPDGIGHDIPPSGPPCRAPVPRRLRFEVLEGQKDMALRITKVVHNPPVAPGRFTQPVPSGVAVRDSYCSN